MKENNLLTFIKGFAVGATMIVPGVSGGTMAMILGIYDALIFALSNFHENPVRNFWYLFRFAIGAGAGLFVFVTPLSWLLEHYNVWVIYFFMGVVFGGIPMIAKKSGAERLSVKGVLYMILGTAAVLFLAAIPQGTLVTAGSAMIMLLTGIVSAAALILPGISISHFFLILGIYEEILKAMKDLEMKTLLPLAAGGVIGIILFSKILNYFMEKYSKQTYLVILGFILGGLAKIFPGVPGGISLIPSLLLFFIGFGIMFQMKKKNR